MANPRKFSEKIALHAQKQAEGTAAFEAILREVSSTTRQAPKQVGDVPQRHHLAQPSFGACRGHSLPNVNQMSSGSVDLQSALSSLENMRQSVNGHPTPDKALRPRGNHPPKKFSLDRHRDCSPYGSVYLSPPDSNWRRASSDSALHASVLAAPASGLSGSSFTLTGRQDETAMLQGAEIVPMDTGQLWLTSKDGRPKSCEVPGISIFPSPDQGSFPGNIPISSNTGSLPDLANLNFPSPLVTPLDLDTQNEQEMMKNACYITPVSMAVQSDPVKGNVSRGQDNLNGVPIVFENSQNWMNFVPPLILHGSNHLFMRDGNAAVVSQDNRFLSSNPGLSPDLPTPPPPPYPSSLPQVRSPPPMITLTDETAGGNNRRILFSDLGDCSVKDDGTLPISYFSSDKNSVLQVSDQLADMWQNPTAPSVCSDKFPSSLSNQSWSLSNAVDAGSLSSGKNLKQFPLSTSPKQASHSFKSSMKSHGIQNGKTPANSPEASNVGDARFSGGIPMSSTAPSVLPPNSQNMLLSLSHGCSAPVTSINGSQQLPDVTYQPQLGVGAGSLLCNGPPRSVDQVLVNLSQAPRLPLQQPKHPVISQQQQQNLMMIQPKLQQFNMMSGGDVVSGNVSIYAIPALQQTPQQQQQQPVIMSAGNLMFMPAASTTSSSAVMEQLPQDQLLYEQALLESLNSQWSQSHQLQMEPSSTAPLAPLPLQPTQYVSTKQSSVAGDGIPDITLSVEDLLIPRSTDGKSIPGSVSGNIIDLSKEDFINTSAYLGDSFDADLLASDDDFLRLGLDPLELDEIQMLSDTTILTDPATEDSFRLDRI